MRAIFVRLLFGFDLIISLVLAWDGGGTSDFNFHIGLDLITALVLIWDGGGAFGFNFHIAVFITHAKGARTGT